jgi:hypothetical protein
MAVRSVYEVRGWNICTLFGVSEGVSERIEFFLVLPQLRKDLEYIYL